MELKKKISLFGFLSLCAVLTMQCSKDNDLDTPDDESETDNTTIRYNDTVFSTSDWSENTHAKGVDPDFDEVFDNTTVKRIDIVISPERWQSMLADMTNLYGEFGVSSAGPGRPPVGGSPGEITDLVNSDENPIFVPADIFFQDKQWYRVGIRFKGNSSLKSAWEQGIMKLSFKLDFDEFEDYYPQIENQRFYGFKKLSLKNNYDDNSFLREKVAAEIFRDAGLVVSHTAFYQVYVDYGEEPVYFGLYTLVEEVDNTVIDTQFTNDNGNLYKPEDTGASFDKGTFSESDFEKKTNEDDGDWRDIIGLFEVLHRDTRISDPIKWRTELETIFDVDVFLNYLAVNTVIQNWDTYGRMTHNYFLYSNPDNDKLTWIPWDNNEALQDGKQGGSLNMDFSDLQTDTWPMIEYLYADEVYRSIYDSYVQTTISDAFEVNSTSAKYDAYATIVEAYATTELGGYSFLNSSSEFQQAISELKQHVSTRTRIAQEYLD